MPFNFSMDAKVFVTYSAEQDKSLELRASDVGSFHEHVQDVKMIVAMPCVCFFGGCFCIICIVPSPMTDTPVFWPVRLKRP